MSADIDIFMAPPATADELVAKLAEFGIFVAARKSGLWTQSVLGLDVAVIAAPDLEDDGGMQLSGYPVQLSFVRYAGEENELRHELAISLARLIGARLAREMGWKCLVVRDLQRELARYG